MADFNVSITMSNEPAPTDLSAGSVNNFIISNPNAGSSYFVLETVKNSNGAYDSNSPKNLEGTFSFTSGISNLVTSSYQAGVVVSPEGGTLTFTPTNAISKETLRFRGTGAGTELTSSLPAFMGLIDEYPGAAAAYSLRKLSTEYTGSIIDIRRNSDDNVNSFSFTSENILDTASIENFVNHANELPLNYSTSPAVAAYSLRKLTNVSSTPSLAGDSGTSSPVVAYSLRKVVAAYTGSAINVRRSSDDTTQDIGFDANGNLDTGSLENFVNTDVTLVESDFSGATPQYPPLNPSVQLANGVISSNESIAGEDDALKFTLNGGSASHSIKFNNLTQGKIGNSFNFSYKVYIPSSNTACDGVKVAIGNWFDNLTNTLDQWISVSFTNISMDDNGDDLFIYARDGSQGTVNGDGDVFYIKDLIVEQSTADGHVEVWYDQSGQANNATQTDDAKQPLIVNTGSIILENSKAAIQFDGVDDFLSNSFASSISQPTYWFVTHNFHSTPTAFGGIIGNNSADAEHRLILNGSLLYTLQAGGAITYNSYQTNQSLISYKIDTADERFYLNGTEQTPSGTGIGSEALESIVLGGLSETTNLSPIQFQEIILFDSDQSSNRTDIEWEINNYYGVFTQWDRENAINVRRSSDDTNLDIGFDANGNLNTGSLENFVNTDVTLITSDFSGATPSPTFAKLNISSSSNESILGVDNTLKFTLQGGAASHYAYSAGLTVGQEYRVTFDYYIPSGQTLDYVRVGVGSPETTFNTTGEWVTGASFTQVAAQTFYIFRFTSAAADNDVFYLKNLTVTQTTSDGHVEVWYDQSPGPSNNATQTDDAKQPLIVNTGSVVLENSKAAIQFDGVDDYLQNTTLVSNQPTTYFTIAKFNQTDVLNRIFDGGVSSTTRHSIFQNARQFQYFAGTTLTGASENINQNLHYFLVSSSTSEQSVNGITPSIGNTGTHTLNGLTFAARWDGAANHSDVLIQELISFDSDQSSNRLGIESNINSYYNTYTPNTTGSVAKWYDQSGNDNHATQTDGARQPLIVEAGSVILENGKAVISGNLKKLNVSSATLQNTFDIFSICNIDTECYIADMRSGDVNGNMILGRRSTGWLYNGSSWLGNGSSVSTATQILANFEISTTSATYHENGLPVETIIHSVNTSTNEGFSIDFLTGQTLKVQELIFFTSSQTLNRPEIELNINEAYNIFTTSSAAISSPPTISGDVQLGSTLTATSSSISGVPFPVNTFRWEISSTGTDGWSAITGETSLTYAIQNSDLGKYLRIVQIATNGVGSPAESPSTSTDVVRTVSGAFVARVVADGGEVENESAGTTQVEYLSNNP